MSDIIVMPPREVIEDALQKAVESQGAHSPIMYLDVSVLVDAVMTVLER